jgi:hypothetical protein
LNLGIPDAFIEHAPHGDMLAACGLDAAGIESAVRARLAGLTANFRRRPYEQEQTTDRGSRSPAPAPTSQPSRWPPRSTTN